MLVRARQVRHDYAPLVNRRAVLYTIHYVYSIGSEDSVLEDLAFDIEMAFWTTRLLCSTISATNDMLLDNVFCSD